MTEAVEGDLLSKLKALHRDRQIRISEITDNGWFPMRDEAIDVLFAAISRAEAERERFQAVCQQIVDKYDDVNLGHEDFRVGAFAAALDAFDGPGLSRASHMEEPK